MGLLTNCVLLQLKQASTLGTWAICVFLLSTCVGGMGKINMDAGLPINSNICHEDLTSFVRQLQYEGLISHEEDVAKNKRALFHMFNQLHIQHLMCMKVSPHLVDEHGTLPTMFLLLGGSEPQCAHLQLSSTVLSILMSCTQVYVPGSSQFFIL